MTEPTTPTVGAVDGLLRMWTYVPSRPPYELRYARIKARLRKRPFPAFGRLKPVTPAARWFVYFIFSPSGELSAAHRVALDRFKSMQGRLMVVFAARSADLIPAEVTDMADALCWKSPPGYDFSAYAIALHEIAERSPGADVCIVNDSIFGPIHDLSPFIDAAPWGMTGFTAHSSPENHLQSYAFIVRQLDPAKLRALRSALDVGWSFDSISHVVALQETRLAREAATVMSVGAFWYAPDPKTVIDPVLVKPFDLVRAGLPFLKKSLLGKMSGFQRLDDTLACIRDHGFMG